MTNLTPQQRQEAERLYDQGRQCSKSKDYIGAAGFYSHAAVYGHPGAQSNLGYLFLNGYGVNRDLQIAARLFLESAKHGSPFGMRQYAI